MGQDDPARGVTDRRYERRLLAAWERFVEAHGGKLWAMNNSPRGAIFLFSLPASDA
jgi:hypothetical protein